MSKFLERFSGTLEPFAELDPEKVNPVVQWITGIPFLDWPQQANYHVEPMKPAMQTNQNWNDFYKVTDQIINELMAFFPGCLSLQRMLSVVMPGQFIDPHKDQQCPEWRCRVHVPLTTNDKALMIMDDGSVNMKVGTAYRINTLATHAIRNDGETPRIHFMFDVRTA